MSDSASKQNFTLVLLFAGTLFISATLMFVLQPMFGKTLLPFLGGTPAVWNTCMVFYQTLLFLAYLYAHYLSSRLKQQRQVQIHGLVIAISLIVLPLTLPENNMPPTDSDPTLWLMGTLLVAIGLPFFIVSTTSPLLQKWFAQTGHHTSDDPYYLYAASNAGSVIALLSYLFLIEPNIGLVEQRMFWSMGYVLLCIFILGCGITLWFRQKKQVERKRIKKIAEVLAWKTKLHWLALAFVPSSLLLALTNFISTDIASVPLLWIFPLVLYLLSFILVFSKWADKIHLVTVEFQAIALLPFIAFAFVDPAALPFWLSLILHLGFFLLTVTVCHGELAKNRPQTQHLTTYYLVISFSGMLGGMFNTFVAPFIFNAVYEYPIMIVVALLLRPRFNTQKIGLQILFPALLFFLGLGIYIFTDDWSETLMYAIANSLIMLAGVTYSFRSKPIALSSHTAVILFFALGIQQIMSTILYQERSFFGVLSVKESVLINEKNRPEKYHELVHGTTNHGSQRLAKQLQTTPLTYYSRSGPIGQLFAVFDRQNDHWKIGSVGLGTGALSCYAKPQQHWTLYEIDPLVIEVAKNLNYFTHLKQCSNKNSKIAVGDARLSLASEKDNTFDLLIMDAFNSDAIPTHLLTREAMALYFAKLKTHGILALHITNRHLEIKKVISDHANYLKLSALIQQYKPQKQTLLVSSSEWVVMAKQAETLEALHQSRLGNWQKLPLYFDIKPWTDDFTNIIGIWK